MIADKAVHECRINIVIATDKGYDHSEGTHSNDNNNSIYLYSALQSL